MEVIRTKSGTRFREKIYVHGRAINSPLFERKSDACQWKRQKQSEVDKAKILGVVPRSLTQRKMLFSDYAKEWVERKIASVRSASTLKNYNASLRTHILPIVGNIPLQQVSRIHADLLVQKLAREKHNEAGINKIMQIFKSVLIGAELDEVLVRSPLRTYPKLKEKKSPPPFWNENDIKKFLLNAVDDEYYFLYVLALNTGMRRGELAGLCWDALIFNRSVIQVRRTRDKYGLSETTKTKEVRYIPMNDIAKKVLLKLFEDRNAEHQYVFSNRFGRPIDPHHVCRKFYSLQKKIKMSGQLRFHGLRHTFASHFVMRGGSLYDLQKILGHSRPEMTQVYAHLSHEHLSNAMKIISFGSGNHLVADKDNSPILAQ